MTVSLKKILEFLEGEKYEILGEKNLEINRVYPLKEAVKGDLSFCNYLVPKGLEMIKESNASIIIASDKLINEEIEIPGKTLVFVTNPRLMFMRIFEKFFTPKKAEGIHPTAKIGKSCVIAENVLIKEYVIIGDNVTIGNNSQIYAGVYIWDNVRIGKNVTIHAGSIIGADGFAYERNERGELEKFPHIGGVIIGDSVEIGANTCIDRGTMTDTVIGTGTKIDNLVHIAHNVQIGKNCVIVALSLIGGSTKIGDYSWIAPCACIRDGLSIGKKATVGMGAVVTKNVNDNTIVYGVPAKPKV